MKRKSIIALLIALCILSCLVLSACKDDGPKREADEVVLQRLIIDQSNKLVYENFVLRRYMGEKNEYELSWTSSDENAIKLTKQDDGYLAEPKMADSRATVTLTATLGSATRDFTVYVRPYNATFFNERFAFSKNQRKVSDDFDLETSVVLNAGTAEERTATIDWSIDEKYQEYAQVVDGDNGGKKVQVNYVKGEEFDVEINATFTYTPANTSIQATTSSSTYEFTVADLPDPGAAAAEWYTNMGSTIEFSGYLVGLGQAYYSGSTLKNVAVYVVDDNFQNAFYFYGMSLSNSSDLNKLQPGVHVSAVGAESTNYNGLIEGKQGTGTLTYDANIERINIEEHIRALDNDIFGNVPGLVRQTGNLVSISGWKVTSKGTAAAGNSSTVLTLQKSGKTITVGTSKYFEGFYVPQNSDPIWKGLVDKADSVSVGDYVNVKGVLSYYNGWQVLPRNAADIEVVSSESPAPSEGTKTATAIAEMDAYLESNGLTGTVPANLSRDLPSEATNGVKLAYRLCTRDLETITLVGNKLTITPVENAEKATVEIKYSLNGYETFTYFTFTSEKLSDEEIVSRIKAQIDANLPATVSDDGDVTLPVKTTFDGVTITWAYKNSGASYNSVTKFEGNVLSIYRADSAETIELRATINYNSSNYTHDVELKVEAYNGNVVVLTPESLGLTSTYKDGTATINRVLVTYSQLYAGGDGIQMRNNDTSKSTITVAFEGKKIVSVKFVFSSTKSTYTNENVLQFDFGMTDSYGSVGTLNTVAGTIEYTFTPTTECSHMRIAHHSSYTYTTYWESITFTLADA